MIIDERTYTVIPGQMSAYLAFYETKAKAIQWSVLGEPIGFFVTEVGELNQVVHLWRYDSMAEREARRAKLAVTPGWSDYVGGLGAYLQKMENRILTPTAFSPLK